MPWLIHRRFLLMTFILLGLTPVATLHAQANNPKACVITSATKLHAPDKTPDTRTTIGVGETVTFTTTEKADWTASSGSPKTGTGISFTWTADCVAGDAKITAKFPGHECSITMKVIEPTGLTWKKSKDLNSNYAKDVQGSGMELTIKVDPQKVNFSAIQIREVSGPASDRTGDFAKLPDGQPFHDASGTGKPFGAWASVKDTGNDVDATDTAASPSIPKPYRDGDFSWVIDNQWKCESAGDDTAKKFTTTTQTFIHKGNDGYLQVKKGGEENHRTPSP